VVDPPLFKTNLQLTAAVLARQRSYPTRFKKKTH